MDENILKKVSGPEKGFASVAGGKVSGETSGRVDLRE